MRTFLIWGTDVDGPQDWWSAPWIERPWTDGGRVTLDRKHRPSVENMYYESAVLAKANGIALGMRSIYHGFEHMALWREVFAAAPGPTLMPFVDTGALSDLVSQQTPTMFDFDDDHHIAVFWDEFLGPFYRTFSGLPLERTPDGRLLVLAWGVQAWIGHGIIGQESAQRLLDYCDERAQAEGFGKLAWLLEKSWTFYAPAIRAYGLHDWFDASVGAYTIREHHGVTVGITVPGFHDHPTSDLNRTIDRRNGATLREALAAMRAAGCDYVFIESYNNLIESAGLYRTDAWGTLYLDIVREHVELTAPPASVPKGVSMIAEYAISMSESFPHPTKAGFYTTWYPKGQRETVLSIEVDGTIGTRHLQRDCNGVPGAWESWRPEGNRAVFPEAIEFRAIPLVG